MKIQKVFRSIALMTCVVFSSNTILLSAPDRVYTITVPDEYGTVSSRWRKIAAIDARGKGERSGERSGSSSGTYLQTKTIIHVQDAHESLEAQENIARITSLLTTGKKDTLIAVEGAVGTINTDLYREFPVREAREAVAHSYLADGVFSGAEYGAITTPKEAELFGAEDESLFFTNFKEYYTAQKEREMMLSVIAQYPSIATELKTHIYNAALFKFDRIICDWENGHAELSEVLPIIIKTFFDCGIDLLDFPGLAAVCEAEETARAFSIDTHDFLRDMERAARTIKHALATSEREHLLIEYDDYVAVLGGLVRLEVKPSDVDYFREASERLSLADMHSFFENTVQTYGLDRSVPSFPTGASRAIERGQSFYHTADERSRVLVRNTLKRMEAKGLDEAFLIAGGYHTEIIEAECRALGIDYVSIAPRIEDATKTVSFYEKMSGALFPIMPHLTSTITAQTLYLMREENRIPFWQELTQKQIAETIRMIITADPDDPATIETIRRQLISFCSREAQTYVADPDTVRAIITSLQTEWKKSFSGSDMGAVLVEEDILDSFSHARTARSEALFKRIKAELESFYVSTRGGLSHAAHATQLASFPASMESYTYLRRPLEFHDAEGKMSANEVIISAAEYAWLRAPGVRKVSDGQGYVCAPEEICESEGFYNCHAVIIRNPKTNAYLFAHVYEVIDQEISFYSETGQRYPSVQDALRALGDADLEAVIIGRPLNEDGERNLSATARVLQGAAVRVDRLVRIKGLFPHLYDSQTILGKWHVFYNPQQNRVLIGAESVFGERFFEIMPFTEGSAGRFEKSARVAKRRDSLKRRIEILAHSEPDEDGEPRRFTPTEFSRQVLRDKAFMAAYPGTSEQTIKNDIRLDSDLGSSPYLDFERGKIDRLRTPDTAVDERGKDLAALIEKKATEGLRAGEPARVFILAEAVRLAREDGTFMQKHSFPSVNALLKDIAKHPLLRMSPYLDSRSGRKVKTLQVRPRREDLLELVERKAREGFSGDDFRTFTPAEAVGLALGDEGFMKRHPHALRRMLLDDIKKDPDLAASPYLRKDAEVHGPTPRKKGVNTRKRAEAFLKVITAAATDSGKDVSKNQGFTTTEAIQLALQDKGFMALFPGTTDDDLRNDIKRQKIVRDSPYLKRIIRGPYVKASGAPETEPNESVHLSGLASDHDDHPYVASPVLESVVDPKRRSYYASIELVESQGTAFLFSDTLARELGFSARSDLEKGMHDAIRIMDTIIRTSGSRSEEQHVLELSSGSIVVEFSHQARRLIGDGHKNKHIVLQSGALQALSPPVRRIVFRVALLQELLGPEAGFFNMMALNAESVLLADALANLENVLLRDIIRELETVLVPDAFLLSILNNHADSWQDQLSALGVPSHIIASMVEASPGSIHSYPVTLFRTLARNYRIATHLFNGNFLLVELPMETAMGFSSLAEAREEQQYVDMENMARIYADFLWGFYMFQSFDAADDSHQQAFLQWNEFIGPLLGLARAPDLRSLQVYIWEKLYSPLAEMAEAVRDVPTRVVGEDQILMHPLQTPRFKEVLQLVGSALNAPDQEALFELIASAAYRLEDPLFQMNTQILIEILPQLVYLQMYLYWRQAHEPPLQKALVEFRELFDRLIRTVPHSVHRRGIDVALADTYEVYHDSPLYTVERYLQTERALSARSFRVLTDALEMIRFRYLPIAKRLYPEAFQGRYEELQKILRRMARLETIIYQVIAAHARYEDVFFGPAREEDVPRQAHSESSDTDAAADDGTTLRDMFTGVVSALGIDAWFGSSYGMIAFGVLAVSIVWMIFRAKRARGQSDETTSVTSRSANTMPALSERAPHSQPGRIHFVFNRHTYFATENGEAARDRLSALFQQADSVYLENANLFMDIYTAVARAEETPHRALRRIDEYIQERGILYFPDEQRRVLEALYGSGVTVRANSVPSRGFIPYEYVSMDALIKGDHQQALDLFETMIYYRAEDAARRDHALDENVRALAQAHPDERIVIVRGMMHTALRDIMRVEYPGASVTDELFSNDAQALMYADLIREAEYQHLGLLDMRDLRREELEQGIYSYILGMEHARVREVTDFGVINDIAAYAASRETFSDYVRYLKGKELPDRTGLALATIEWFLARGYIAPNTARRFFGYGENDKTNSVFEDVALQGDRDGKDQVESIDTEDTEKKARAITRYVEDTVHRLEKYRNGGNDFITYFAFDALGKKLPFVVKEPLPAKEPGPFLAELREAKEIMSDLAAPFSILRDVNVAGKEHALLLVQKRLEIFDEGLPRIARSRDGREIDLWREQAALMIELIQRGIKYPDAFTPVNFGFDRETGRLYFVDLGGAHLAETDHTFFARADSVLSFEQRYYFYTYTVARGLDEVLRMHSDRPCVEHVWGTQRQRCVPVPDISPVSPRAAQYQLGTVSLEPLTPDVAIQDGDASAALQYEQFVTESLNSYETLMRHFAPKAPDDFRESIYNAAEYLVHRQHVLDKKVTLVVTDEIRRLPVYQFLMSQVGHLAIRIEAYDQHATYDPQEHIILAYEDHARSEARDIKRARPDLLVIGFDPTNAGSAIEFLPTIIATVLWLQGTGQIDESRLFGTAGFSGDLQNMIVIDGQIAAELLSDIHTEFLQAQFNIAA